MLVDTNSTIPEIDSAKAKQKIYLEECISMTFGDSEHLGSVMLNALLVLLAETEWAPSTICDVEYIKPLEKYCSKIRPCDVPVSLLTLLSLIGKSSSGECVRICESSIPSFLLKCMMMLTKNKVMSSEIGECLLTLTTTLESSSAFLAHHKTQFVAFLDGFESKKSVIRHSTFLPRLCFSPNLEMSSMVLKALNIRCKTGVRTRPFVYKLDVPSDSTDSSSKLVPFVELLCGRLAKHVSEMKSLSTDSSPDDPTISALSAALPADSQLLDGNAVLVTLSDGLALLSTFLVKQDSTFHNILVSSGFVPLLKSTIIACLDLLEHPKTESTPTAAERTDLLITIIDTSWYCAAGSLPNIHRPLHPVVESTFSDVPQLCSLLVRTCRFSPPTRSSHLAMLIDISAKFTRLIPAMLDENLAERLIDSSKPMAVPTTNSEFHVYLVWIIHTLVWDPKAITQYKEQQKSIRMHQFERVLKPAKQYLSFVLQREEFIPKFYASNQNLPSRITFLLDQTMLLERDLFENGLIVETGRDKWEVWWLVETTDERDLGERLRRIREDDEMMRRKEMERWKARVVRRREAGHEDAMEGWLTTKDSGRRDSIVEYVVHVRKESGMNNTL
ncbi:hypothetical protein BLNAU_22115 [Blattamonas nauphoetae]|uniref:Uncharacterized protein n=1 Tax=Blattamonas nauphoetae TaxID=2049346 RepID=A0ABQ9WX07_9EUKA|nr:hypothetical protein BLNAU_22115 [Blattamonas nauphoetae]